jgi:hypothetical protein
MRRSVLVAVAIIVTGSSPVFAQSTADAVKAWVTSIDATAEWTARYSTLTEDADNGTAIVTGLSIHSEKETGLRFDFDKVTLKGLPSDTSAPFSADEISIDHGTIAATNFGLTVDDVSFEGLALPAFNSSDVPPDNALAAMTKINEMFSALKLDHAGIGKITNTTAAIGAATEVTYEGLSIDGLSDGKLSSLAAGPVRVKTQSTETGPFSTTLNRFEVRGIDMQTVLDTIYPTDASGEDTGGDNPWRTVLSLVSYRGMTVEDQKNKVTVDDISLEDVKVRKPPAGYAAKIRRMLSGETMTEEESEQLSQDVGFDVIASVAFGRLSMRNLDATGPEFDKFRLGGFTLRDVSIDSLGEISLDGLAVSVPDQGSFNLERFAIGGIVLPKLAVLQAAAQSERGGLPPDPATLIPQIAFIEFLGAKGVFDDKPGSLDRLRFDLRDYIGAIPTTASADLRGLQIPAAAVTEESAREILRGLGIDRISVDYGYRVRWRESDAKLFIDDIHLQVADVGSLTVSVVLGGLTREMLVDSFDTDKMMENLTFEEARIVFEDKSITDRAIRYFAKQSDADPETLRQETADAIPLTLRVAITDQSLREKIAPALKAFLLKPGRLTITASAKEPNLRLGMLVMTGSVSPQDLPSVLNIEVTQE